MVFFVVPFGTNTKVLLKRMNMKGCVVVQFLFQFKNFQLSLIFYSFLFQVIVMNLRQKSLTSVIYSHIHIHTICLHVFMAY